MSLKKSLFDLSKDYLLITSAKGVIKEYNASFAEYCGYGIGELNGKEFSTLVYKDDFLPAKMLFSPSSEMPS